MTTCCCSATTWNLNRGRFQKFSKLAKVSTLKHKDFPNQKLAMVVKPYKAPIFICKLD